MKSTKSNLVFFNALTHRQKYKTRQKYTTRQKQNNFLSKKFRNITVFKNIPMHCYKSLTNAQYFNYFKMYYLNI